MSSPSPGGHGAQPHNKGSTLDPTGMFRNRGRHVVSRNDAPQDRRPLVNSGQSLSPGSLNTEHIIGHVAPTNDELNSGSPDRSLTSQGGIASENIHTMTPNLQSSRASSGEEDCSCGEYCSSDSQKVPANTVEEGGIAPADTECTSHSAVTSPKLNAETLGLVHPKDSDDADETDSTVSIMGSIINDDLDEDEGLKKMDAVRWKSTMRIYRSNKIQEVQENYDEDDQDVIPATQPVDDDEVDKHASGLKASSHVIATNSALQQENLNDTMNSYDEESPVNVSMECHADTSHFIDESEIIIEDEMIDNMHSNVVKVADFSEMETDVLDSECLEISPNKELISCNDKDTIQGSHKPPMDSSPEVPSKVGQESPLRAAFRRTENNIRRMTSPRLPPSFDDAVNPSTRVANNSVLPLPLQLATKCFSFDDTTIDEDLTVPYRPQLNMFRPDSPKRRLPRQQQTQYQQSKNTEYYGLSAVASFPDEEKSSLRKTIPLRRTSKSFTGVLGRRNPKSISSKHQQSTRDDCDGSFSVIRRSKTWDNHANTSQIPSDQKATLLHSDVEKVQRSHHMLKSSTAETLVRRFEETNSTLSGIAALTARFNVNRFKSLLCKECAAKTESNIFSCNECSELFAQRINSIKEVLASDDKPNDPGSPESNEMRTDAVDLLTECYNFAREVATTKMAQEIFGSGHADHMNIANHSTNMIMDSETVIDAKDKEIARLNSEISACREEIGRLRSLPQPSVDRSMLSSSEDSLDAFLQPDNSLILYSPHPVVKLSESNEESFAIFERRMDAELKVESMKEIIKLKAALEEANNKIALLESANKPSVQEEPFPSDIEPITGNDDVEIFMKIAEDIENSTEEEDLSQSQEVKPTEATFSVGKVSLENPCLEKELDAYRAAIIESINATRFADVEQDMSKSCDSEVTEQKMISVRMLDAENFVTEWDSVSPLPPPPDHGLNSPIVETILTRWTDDQQTQSALLRWAEAILDGSNPDDVPPLKIAGIDHQLKEGFIMHIFPLLLRRKDIHVHLSSRATRTTSYDIAVSISSATNNLQANENANARGDESASMRLIHRDNKHHLMAFRATRNGSTKENDNSQVSQGHNFPSIIRSESNAGSCFSAVTTPISNRTPTKVASNRIQRYMNDFMATGGDPYDTSNEFPDAPQLPIMAGASSSLVDDLSVGSSGDEEDTSDRNQEPRQSGIMNSIGGAFGLLSRKKSPVSSSRSPNSKSAPNGAAESPPNMYLTPQKQAANGHTLNDNDHPFHRLVSAPPGKIGLTFIEHRGHCMVSNVTEASPLNGYVHPSDILIAIDETPVSGLRTREIVNILTAKKNRRRDLTMISSHDMAELIRPGRTT